MRFFITCLSVFTSLMAFGQINEADTTRWQYRLTSTGVVLGGNLNDFVSSSRIELAQNGPRWGLYSGTSYTYKNREHETIANDVTSRNILYYGHRRRVYPFGFASISKSLRRGIDLQYQLGPGVAYRLFSSQDSYLRLGSAALYERTRYEGDEFVNYDLRTHTIDKWRLLAFVAGTHVLQGGRLRLVYEVSWQPAFQSRNNRTYALAGAELPLGRYVALRGNLEYIRENVVLVEKSKYDLLVTFGITITNMFRTHKSEEADEE